MDQSIPKPTIWWKRLTSWIIDLFIVEILAIAWADAINEHAYERIIAFIMYIFYCFLLEGFYSKTIGKYIMGIIVVDSKSFGFPSIGQIIGRTFSRLIPFEALSFINERPRGWHDSFPNTTVISVKSKDIFRTGISPDKYLPSNPIKRGLFRLLISLSILVPLIFAAIKESNEYYSNGDTFWEYFILGFLVSWALIFSGIWISEGFEEDKKL